MIVPYLLLAAIGAGLYMAFNIGANDVANAMGTSVGAGSLTLRRAVIVAALFSFLGAVLAGGYVTETIRKGIINPANFAHNPHLLLSGMIAVLLGAGIWITIATYLGLPVSTTHSVVGALIGFGLIGAGIKGVNWKAVSIIISSWIISPIAGIPVAYLLFRLIRDKILNSPRPFNSAKKIGPFFVAMVLFVLSLAFIYGGLKHFSGSLPFPSVLGMSVGVALVGALISHIFLKKYSVDEDNEYEEVENLSKPLQVLSASYEAFALGSNDVANAVGPVAAIIAIMETQKVTMQVPVPMWVLAVGGIGLAVGISTWGWRVIETIGRKITQVTPTRGFAAEFSAATVVLLCSRVGIPVSTTHVSVGTVIGIGMAKGISAINFKVIRNIIVSWLLTLPVAAGFTIFIYLIISKLVV
ncbi:inorganic phosphate transporter [Candidatus Aerophobetes bacterium]|nr:inorganic phosphate transporter [Candidatus Aerophobetes bacterium]